MPKLRVGMPPISLDMQYNRFHQIAKVTNRVSQNMRFMFSIPPGETNDSQDFNVAAYHSFRNF